MDQMRLKSDSPGRSLSETERAIAEIWSESLQLKDLPQAGDDFFDLGGDSMTMTMVEFRIQEELSKELPAGILLRTPSLGELSAAVDAARSAHGASMHDGSPTVSDNSGKAGRGVSHDSRD